MKVSLSTISAISKTSIKSTIVSSYKTSLGDNVFNYEIYLECSTSDLLSNDVSSINITLLPSKSNTPTNDFKKIASGDLSPIRAKSSTSFTSLEEESATSDASFGRLESFAGGKVSGNEKGDNFSKNKVISKSILTSHIQLKQSIKESRLKDDQTMFGSESVSVDSIVNSDSKKALLKSKMKNAIMSSKGDTISDSSISSDIFFDGGVKFTSIKKRIAASSTTTPQNKIPLLETFLIQKSNQSALSSLGATSEEYEIDSQGAVVSKSGFSNIDRTTVQDELQGIIERGGYGLGLKSSLEPNAKSAAWSSALNLGIPPSQLIEMSFSNFINTASDNYGGLSTTRRSSQLQLGFKNDDISQIVASLRSSFLNVPGSAPEKMSDVSDETMIATSYQTTSEKSSLKCKIPVNQSNIHGSGEISLLIEAVNTAGRSVQVITKVINHQKNIDDFYVPKHSPEISASQSEDCLTRISVKQVDSNCNKIIVFKKVLNQAGFRMGSIFKKINEIKLTSKDSDHSFSLLSSPGESIMVRAISISNSGQIGPFRDVVVLPTTKLGSSSREKNFTFASIVTQNTPSGILVESMPTAGNSVASYIVRRNISKGERIFLPITSLKNNKIGMGNRAYQIIDTSVNIGETYEYKTKFIFKNGSEVISETCSVVKREMIIDSISATASTPSFKKGKTENTYSIFLNSSINIPQSDADMTREIFESLDLSDLFESEIASIKNQFENIAIFHVTRTDVSTGEEYDLGLKASGEIKDSGDADRGVPAPTSGEYIYKLEVLCRTPDSILAEIEKTQPFRNIKNSRSIPSVVASKTSGESGASIIDIDFNYTQKFTSPTAIRSSTLAYGNSIVSNYAEGAFDLGKTGIVTTINVSIPAKDIKIVSKSVRLNTHGDVLLRWSVRGDLTKIDHFIIVASRGSITIPVGTHHGYSAGSNFLFTDTSQKGIIGTVLYYIIPVFSDLSQGERFKAGSISIVGEE